MPLLGSSIAQNHSLRSLVASRLVTARRLAPWRYRIAAAGSFTFTTAVRMIHRIHRHASYLGPQALPARSPGFTQGNVFVLDVADLSDRGPAN